jgi:hypothetical protein
MPYLIKSDNTPPPRRPHGLPFSAWAWLTYPLIPDLTAAGRRKHLLAWLLISSLLLTLATIALVLIVNVPASAVGDVNGDGRDGRPNQVLVFDMADVLLNPNAELTHLIGWLKNSQVFIGFIFPSK